MMDTLNLGPEFALATRKHRIGFATNPSNKQEFLVLNLLWLHSLFFLFFPSL